MATRSMLGLRFAVRQKLRNLVVKAEAPFRRAGMLYKLVGVPDGVFLSTWESQETSPLSPHK